MEDQKDLAKELIEQMRVAFDRRDWERTLLNYEQLANIKMDRGLRVEGVCLAARALSAEKQRSAARVLLKEVAAVEYKKPVHYEFLARAYLDLKQYKNAAEACERADKLRIAEAKGA